MTRHRAIILTSCVLVLGIFLLVRGSLSNLEPPPPCQTPPTLPDMIQARDGYTLTIRPIYADANRVVLDAHFTMLPDGQPRYAIRPEEVHLIDDDGHELPWSERFNYINVDFPDNRIAFAKKYDPFHFVLSFNAVGHPLPANLPLHLALYISGSAGDSKAPHFRTGPYQFEFTMHPEQGVRAAAIQQTVESPNISKSSFRQVPAQKIQLVLEGVVVTCAEAQIFLRSTTPGTLLTDAFSTPPLDLTVGDWSAESLDPRPAERLIFTDRVGDLLTISVIGMPRDQVGVWAISVPQLYGTVQSGGRALPQIFQGPWAFRFTLPPARRTQTDYHPNFPSPTPTR